MCEVFRGQHRETGSLVAIKILPAQTARNEILLKRFEQEFRVASQLDHPNIVRALDFWDLPGQPPFLVLELVEGESLGEKVEREGPLPEDLPVRLMGGVCRGLQYAHERGVIHRDIKPDNLLLTTGGEVRITDFGLVKELLFDQGLTKTGRGLGTPHYMAPEQFRDAKTVDLRADIYGLGATLYTLVTGIIPFDGMSPLDAWLRKTEARLKPPRAIVPSLSPHIERVIVRAMQGDPQRRHSSCAEFLRELLSVQDPNPHTRAGGNGRQNPPIVESRLTEVWYVRYQDHEGQEYLLQQPLEKVRQYLAGGRFKNARSVRISRAEAGPFLPPEQFEEFRELTREAQPAQNPAENSSWGLWLWFTLALLSFGIAMVAGRFLQ
jgi:serine/threonine protein kinase